MSNNLFNALPILFKFGPLRQTAVLGAIVVLAVAVLFRRHADNGTVSRLISPRLRLDGGVIRYRQPVIVSNQFATDEALENRRAARNGHPNRASKHTGGVHSARRLPNAYGSTGAGSPDARLKQFNA